jgi:anti-sigma factor RsiW
MSSLRCAEYVELAAAYVDGGLDPGRSAAVEHHGRSCRGCRCHLDQLRAVVDGLRELGASDGWAEAFAGCYPPSCQGRGSSRSSE